MRCPMRSADQRMVKEEKREVIAPSLPWGSFLAADISPL